MRIRQDPVVHSVPTGTHGWINVLIGPCDLETLGLQHSCQRGHGGATDADQVNVLLVCHEVKNPLAEFRRRF